MLRRWGGLVELYNYLIKSLPIFCAHNFKHPKQSLLVLLVAVYLALIYQSCFHQGWLCLAIVQGIYSKYAMVLTVKLSGLIHKYNQ